MINGSNKRICKHTCENNGLFQLENNSPALINMKCKCPRNNGGRTCGWYSGKLGGLVTQESLSAVSCNEPVIQSEFQPLTDHIDNSLTFCTDDNIFRSSDDKIINGVDTLPNSWPFIVRLYLVESIDADNGFGCGGSVIHPHWVLTAAHCCPNVVRAYADFGSTIIDDNDEDGEFQLTSTTIISHPLYGDDTDGDDSNQDLCLIKFDADLTSGTTVELPCLPTEKVKHGDACWVAGWGVTEEGVGSNTLKSVGINVMSQEYCLTHAGFSLQSDDICAGIPDLNGDGGTDGGKDSCQGDSGGPLICNQNGQAILTGVVSRGGVCAAENSAGIYSSTFEALDWIIETIQNN